MKKILFLLFVLLSLNIQARPGLLDNLGLSNDFDTPPSVDEAFNFSAQALDANTVIAHWEIADGNYLYRDKISFEIVEDKYVQLLDYSLPAGENKVDEIFGLTEVYQHDTEIRLPLNHRQNTTNITLIAHYQGCSETFHICYPPTDKTIQLQLPPINTEQLSSTSLESTLPAMSIETLASASEQDRLAKNLAEDTLFKILFGFFGLGLLLAFTPCVFPMIPILSSIIVGEGEKITTRRAFSLSLAYILAMSITYTVAGVMTGLLGENIQAMFQNPWIIGSFSALFVVLSLSMFGLFELQIPHVLQHRLHLISHQQQGGKLAGAALMGLLSGLIVGPCLAPPLAAALIFIGQQGDPILGGSALFALSMGMGLPLLIIGTSAGSLLPKAGDWMNTIKSIFGVLMLALAIWMLERIIPGWVSLLLWGGLLIVTAIYLGALDSLKIDATGWHKLWKGIGLIFLIYGVLLMVGGSSGSQNVWQPLQSASATSSSSASHKGLAFTQATKLTEIEQQLSQSGKPTMLDFYADWCTDCKRMEVTTFQDSNVLAALKDTKPLQLDMTANNDGHKAVLQHFGVFAPPTLLFFDASGKEFRQHRIVGYVSAEKLTQHIANLPLVAH